MEASPGATDWIVALAAAIQAFATIALLLVTIIYVRATRKIAESNKLMAESNKLMTEATALNVEASIEIADANRRSADAAVAVSSVQMAAFARATKSCILVDPSIPTVIIEEETLVISGTLTNYSGATARRVSVYASFGEAGRWRDDRLFSISAGDSHDFRVEIPLEEIELTRRRHELRLYVAFTDLQGRDTASFVYLSELSRDGAITDEIMSQRALAEVCRSIPPSVSPT